MSKKRFTKSEMDEKFEQFLKESVSDADDVDSDAINQILGGSKTSARGKAQDLPWWMMSDDDESPRKPGHSWMKPKKTEPEPELKFDSKEKEHNRESPQKQPGLRDEVGMSKDSLEDPHIAGLPNASGVKSNDRVPLGLSSELDDTMTSTDMGPSPGPSPGPGVDTLEEIADKERFFKDLEQKEGTRNIDFARLNRETELSGTLQDSRVLAGIEEKDEDVETQSESQPTVEEKKTGEQLSKGGAGGGSKSGSGGMLAKVSLLDSLDSSLGTVKIPGTSNESRGLLNAGTATEMEALQRALHEVASSQTLNLEETSSDIREAQESAYSRLQDEKRDANNESMDYRDYESTRDTTDFAKTSQDTDKDSEFGQHGMTRTTVSTHKNRSGVIVESRGFDLMPSNQFDVTSANESRGFDLMPAPEAEQNRGFDLSPAVDDSRGFDLTPVPAVRVNRSSAYGESVDSHSVDPRIVSLTEDKVKKPNNRTIKLPPSAGRSKATKIPTKQVRKDAAKKESKKKEVKRDVQKDKYKHVKSSDYGTKKGWSPADTTQRKIKGTETISLEPKPKDTQLVASVESFAQYIKHHFAADKSSDKLKHIPSEEETIIKKPLDSQIQQLSRERALLSEVQDWQGQWKEERRQNQKLRAEILSLQRQHERDLEEMRLQHENDVFRIKQENMILVAKLSNDEDGGKARSEIKTKLADVKDSAEKVKLMEKEMQNQEILLEGYHQENKRLYKEIQEFKTENKEEESKWKSENQKFKTEISNLREQIEEKERQLKNKGIITGVQKEIAAGTGTAVMGAGKIAHLQAEVQEAQVTEIELKQRMKALEGSKSELERYIDVLVKEKKDAEQRLVSAMERKDTEIQAVQNQHEKDTEALHKKLKWYAENQDLLDKDAQALKDKDDDIKRLKEQIEEIQQQKEEKKKLNENQRRAKERAADAKKIQDLERQVKEMENILRRRNPNSLPAMIFAAATAPSDVTHTTSKTKATVFLEERIQKLEKEADEREQEAKRSLRTMEQKYNAMKLKYEERISSLEKELNSFKRPDHSSEHPHSHMVAVEKELKSVRERYQREVDDLKEKLDFLQRNSKTKITGDSQPQEKIIESLQDDVRIRDEELLKLRLKCQQLEVDYMNAGISNLGETKHYTPRNFAGKHISDVMDENARLRQQVERTSFEIDQQRVHVQKSIAEAESAVRKSKEEAEDKISLIRLNHEAELQRIILEHSSKLGDSNVSRLTCQLNAQEVMITHLKEQLSHYKQEAERLKAAEIRERALQQNIYLLSDELKEAKKHHTPAMKHFEALQSKIEGLENRHVVREQELKGIVEKASLAATAQKEEELQYFKQQLRDKNLELQKFRTELDTLLQVMEELQQQGVVIHSHPQKSLTHY